MNNPYRILPPLGSFVGFEAAARLGSFSQAAEELNMTQSAISHQVRTLEQHLGQPLFLRINRRVELTDAGSDMFQTAQNALETFRHGVQRLGAFSKPGSVILHMPPSLGAQWFLPRLPALRSLHPAVDPWLFTTDEQFDLSVAEVDISVTQTPFQGEGVVRQILFHDSCVPMASPQLAAQFCDSLDSAPLLHDESEQDWQKWFDRAGITREDVLSGPNFSDSAMMLQAAAQGIGLCLGSRVLASAMLASGQLVEVASLALKVEHPTYIVTLERHLRRPSVRALWDWLLAQDVGDAASSRKKHAD